MEKVSHAYLDNCCSCDWWLLGHAVLLDLSTLLIPFNAYKNLPFP